MKRRNRRYSKEFKLEALRLTASSDRPLVEIEDELGITRGLLSAWGKKYQVNAASKDLELSKLAAAQAEIKRLERELAEAREERDILKKAVSIFSQKRQP